MIVFAVHGIIEKIEIVLEQLNKFNKIDVLIVDTNSPSDIVRLFYEKNKDKYKFNLYYERINYMCYDSGAYINAFKKYDVEKYYFFQDSIEFINESIFIEINQLLDKFDVVAISSFPLIFDNYEQINWVFNNLEINTNINLIDMQTGRSFVNLPIYGIFGPMFSIKRETLLKIPNEWITEPINKNQAMAMERKWPIIFYLLNLSVTYIEKDHMIFLSGDTKWIKKYMLARQ